MTELRCKCGTFRAELSNFPQNTPGRCVCYCDDCQTYAHHIGRTDLLDAHGGTEIIPVYPNDMKITQGQSAIACVRLSPKGLFRFYTSCCNTPLGNSVPKFPWFGMLSPVFTVSEASYLERVAGPIKCRIQGKDARGTPPPGTSQKAGFKDFVVIFPFLLKGFLFGKAKNSPFYKEDGATPLMTPQVLTLEERNRLRAKIGLPT